MKQQIGSGEACLLTVELVRGSTACRKLPIVSKKAREKITYAPRSPISGHQIFSREGVGVYILKPPRGRKLLPPPLFYTPATPRRVFSWVGGWGCV